MPEDATLLVRDDRVLFSEIGDDIVALDVGRGQCFGMEDVSATVWRLLAVPTSLDSLCEELMAAYDVDPDICRRDVAELIERLRAEGLVVTAA
ncbi:PqqD family protein [Sphingomonas jaspsi]|uniref:PqqD family protein n=1 Tax=Sphingomonas jaspsi TaxID=392409 RepID=UPI0004AD699B|nr:PqqD family protein [Sphingomonas jaspsi]